jgi:hypothetical protein
MTQAVAGMPFMRLRRDRDRAQDSLVAAPTGVSRAARFMRHRRRATRPDDWRAVMHALGTLSARTVRQCFESDGIGDLGRRQVGAAAIPWRGAW